LPVAAQRDPDFGHVPHPTDLATNKSWRRQDGASRVTLSI